MRALLSALILLVAVAGCERHGPTPGSHGPIPESDRRKYYGDCFIYQGAPFCCLYVGLDTNETALFATNFWRFADQHGIHKPKKHYTVYSGARLATCKSDHVSLFVDSTPTTNIVARSERFGNPNSKEQVSWGFGWMATGPPTHAVLQKVVR
jgi:hypothetical protein